MDKTEFRKVPTIEAEARDVSDVYSFHIYEVWKFVTKLAQWWQPDYCSKKRLHIAVTQFFLSVFVMFISVFSFDSNWRLHMFPGGPVIYVYLIMHIFYTTFSTSRCRDSKKSLKSC